MVDTPAPGPAAAPAPVATPARPMKIRAHEFWHIFSYLFPGILLLGGFYLAPSLRITVFNGPSASDATGFYVPMIVEIILSAIWIVIDFFSISNALTRGSRIRENAFFSILIMILLLIASTFMATKGALGYWLLIPTIAAIIDAFVSADRGINSALTKQLRTELELGPRT